MGPRTRRGAGGRGLYRAQGPDTDTGALVAERMHAAVDRCVPRPFRGGGAFSREGDGHERVGQGEAEEGEGGWVFKGRLILTEGWSKADE
jgi:hypothetical protein